MAAREINPPIPLTTTCLFWAIADYALKDNNSDLHSLFSEGFTADEQNALSQRRREYVTGDFWNGFQEITSTASVALSDGMTRYVGRVVELAHHYSGRQDSSKGRIGPSHLLFALLDRDALLSNSSSDELGIFGLLRATEIDPQQLRQKVRNILAQYLDNQQVGYGTDTVTTNDLLNIDVLVKPLAMLVAAHTTVPPLAIGIFGDWGSGKSFFMNRLKQQICLLAANAKASGSPQKDISFFKHIICIDFNAWHYVESNLWASLMEHIFAELSKQGVYSDALGAPLRPSDESQKKVLTL